MLPSVHPRWPNDALTPSRRDHVATVRSRLPVVMHELLFSGQPVVNVLAVVPPARLVEVVCEASDLVPRRALAGAGVLGRHPFARDDRCDIGARHGCVLVML